MNTSRPGRIPALHILFTWMSDLGKTSLSSPNVIFLQSFSFPLSLIFLSCISSAHFHFLSRHIPIFWPSPPPHSSLYTLEHHACVLNTLGCNPLISRLGWRPLKLIQRPLLIHGAPVRSSLALPLSRLVSHSLFLSFSLTVLQLSKWDLLSLAHIMSVHIAFFLAKEHLLFHVFA